MQTRHSMVVVTTPRDKNKLAGLIRLICISLAQLSPNTHSSKAHCPITVALNSMCYMGSTQNHHGRT
eukprot:9503571-Ditylum_brightwellii.AAC.1